MIDLEAVCVKFPLNRGNLFKYCLYIQPGAKNEIYEAHTKAISTLVSQLSVHDVVSIEGDFNLPAAHWVENDDNFDYLPIIGESTNERASIARFVTTELMDIGLFQLNNVPNCSGNVLDLVYTNCPELVAVNLAFNRLISIQASDKAHNPLDITIECDPKIYPGEDNSESIFCFRKADFDRLNDQISLYDFQTEFADMGVDGMLQRFYEIMNEVFEECVPKSSIRKSNNPAWFSRRLCNLKNVRNRAYKKLCTARKSNPDADPSKFEEAQDRFAEVNREEYEEYIKNIGVSLKSDPKRFWNFVNNKRKSNGLPCKLNYNEISATTDSDKANLFADFFSSVYTAHSPDDSFSNDINSRPDHNCWNITVSPESVQMALESMDISKGRGPDGMPPIFLRQCAESLVAPLCLIFEKSLSDGVYPDMFKVGRVIPIHKSGSKTNVKNFRGVTVMCNVAKAFESLVYNQLKLSLSPLISKHQHGFVSNRCIDTNLMEFTNYIHEAFELGHQVDVFYGDIAKAFDSVSQPLFMRKLMNYPIGNKTLKWIHSYTSNRKQFVEVGTEKSRRFEAHSAIGQGTICGPFLFLLFFNDSDNNCGPAKVFNFADDKKIAFIIKSEADSRILQSAISNYGDWCDHNGLALNPVKCGIMTYSRKRSPIVSNYLIDGVPINRLSEVKDLGVLLDSKLSFVSHMEFIRNKANSVMAFVKRECYKSFDVGVARTLYTSLVRSNLEFASSIWKPHHNVHKQSIESTQKNVVIYLRGDNLNRKENGYVLSPYVDRCKDLNFETLARRRVNADVLFIKKIISGQFDAPALRKRLNLNLGTRTLRNPEFIRIRGSRSDFGLNSPFNIACRAFNHAALFIDPTIPFWDFRNKLIRLPDSAFGDLTKI